MTGDDLEKVAARLRADLAKGPPAPPYPTGIVFWIALPIAIVAVLWEIFK